MKIWIGKDDAMRYRMQHPEREKEMAIYAFRYKRKFRLWPRLSIDESRALFFHWLGLIVWIAPVGFIAGLCKWEFRDPTTCGYDPAIHGNYK